MFCGRWVSSLQNVSVSPSMKMFVPFWDLSVPFTPPPPLPFRHGSAVAAHRLRQSKTLELLHDMIWIITGVPLSFLLLPSNLSHFPPFFWYRATFSAIHWPSMDVSYSRACASRKCTCSTWRKTCRTWTAGPRGGSEVRQFKGGGNFDVPPFPSPFPPNHFMAGQPTPP